MHAPEQHCAAVEQLCPSVTHALAPHFPPEHERSQHSALPVQLAPDALQNCEELHLCVVESQTVEQQSAPVVQFSPPGLHATWTGAAQVPALHAPEQQSAAAEHAPEGRHCPAGSTQVFAAHALVQQSALVPHAPPTGLHADGSAHVPLHAPEQHSDGSAQPAPRSLHDVPWLPGCCTGAADPFCDAEPQPAFVTLAHATRSARMLLPRIRTVPC